MSKEDLGELIQKECILCRKYYFDDIKNDMRCPDCREGSE